MSNGTKYTIVTNDGRTFEGQLGVTIRKVFDKRNRDNDAEQPQVVYECEQNGLIVRVFADEVSEVNGVPV